MKKLKKWQLTALIAVPLVIVVVVLAMLLLNQKSGSQEALDSKPLVQKAKEGSVASSVLLSGQVSANNEQYIYYDSTKGDLEGVLVNVGDQVTVGQALVHYRNTEAQFTNFKIMGQLLPQAQQQKEKNLAKALHQRLIHNNPWILN